ncbi:universal stress protein [Saccharothrix sp. ST-888]|uniref:universal stress protein n=1 Tax=Saccharothrix sp. ST-888 TaxID=1427391 RepID=UPI0007C66591|nr:universal stress protein [Saccharothrix sp. ST-888]
MEHSREDGAQRRLVVGVSGSLGSLAALHRAVAEARRTGAEVLAVLVWEPPGGEHGYRRSPCPPMLAAFRDTAVERLRTALDEAFGGAPADLGVRFQSQAVRSEPGYALVQLADRPGDVLVVGAGRGSRLRPSVARYCLRHAACPVLAVPRPVLQRELEHRRPWSVRNLRTLWHPRTPETVEEDLELAFRH